MTLSSMLENRMHKVAYTIERRNRKVDLVGLLSKPKENPVDEIFRAIRVGTYEVGLLTLQIGSTV